MTYNYICINVSLKPITKIQFSSLVSGLGQRV
jgi:hypothetical protein